MDDYAACDATELARRVRDGEVHPTELVEVAIEAIERVNPRLNAVVHRMYDTARSTAAGELPEGPLRGVPMVVKDSDGFVGGVPYTASTRALLGFVPDHDAEAIARLRRSGTVFLAKTNLPELALLGTTESELRGPARNPWNTGHSTGGSSGGSAALVAARAVPIGHGGDGGGSLRIPGSHCGVVGFKATRGRVPVGPDGGEGWGGYVQWGALTRSVRDAAAVLDVMAGPMPGDPYFAPPQERPFTEEVGADPGRLRVGFSGRSLYGRSTDPECAAVVTEVAAALEELGHDVEEAHPPVDPQRMVQAYLTQVAVGTAAMVRTIGRWTGREPKARDFEPATWMMAQIGRVLTGVEVVEARDACFSAGRIMARWHERYDLFLGPTVAYPPVPIGKLDLKRSDRVGLRVLRAAPVGAVLRKVLDEIAAEHFDATPNTQLFNQTGQPAVSLPLHRTASGLPLGAQLAGRFGDEATLLRVAAQLEEARPWAQRQPQVCA